MSRPNEHRSTPLEGGDFDFFRTRYVIHNTEMEAAYWREGMFIAERRRQQRKHLSGQQEWIERYVAYLNKEITAIITWHREITDYDWPYDGRAFEWITEMRYDGWEPRPTQVEYLKQKIEHLETLHKHAISVLTETGVESK